MSNTESAGCALENANHVYRFTCRIKEYSTYYGVNATVAPEIGKWTSLVGTYDGKTMKLYIDGVLNGSYSVTGTISPSNIPINIFAEQNADKYVISQGSIKEVFAINDTMTAEEVASWYNGNDIDNSNAVFHYKFDEVARHNKDFNYKINNLNGVFTSITCNHHTNYNYKFGTSTVNIPNIIQSDVCNIGLN